VACGGTALAFNSLRLINFVPGELAFYGVVLKSAARVALVGKAADGIRITFFLRHFEVKK
jgi:hypothetical protein